MLPLPRRAIASRAAARYLPATEPLLAAAGARDGIFLAAALALIGTIVCASGGAGARKPAVLEHREPTAEPPALELAPEIACRPRARRKTAIRAHDSSLIARARIGRGLGLD